MRGYERVIALLALVLTTLSGLACTTVGPGHVGIKVNNFGSERGVEDYPTRTGMVFYNPMSSTVFEYPTSVQTVQWTASLDEGNPINEEITFSNKDQMKIAANVSLSYSLDPLRVPAFYVKFRSDDLRSFTHGILHNVARDSFNEVAGHYAIEQIMGDNGPFLLEVRDHLQKTVKPWGVNIEQFGFIGVPRPPETVIAQINAKVQALQSAQQAENEVRRTEALARQRIAAAEGEARSNQILTQSLSPQLLQWRTLELQQQATAKWNGALPSMMGGSGAVPFIQVPAR